jgi:hypothetical protein
VLLPPNLHTCMHAQSRSQLRHYNPQPLNPRPQPGQIGGPT